MSPPHYLPVAAVNWAVLVGLAGASGSWLIFWLTVRGKRRALSYAIRSRALVQVSPEAQGKVEVYYEQSYVVDPHFIEVEIVNVGRVPIRATDFERPVRIALPSPAGPMGSTLSFTGEPYGVEPMVSIGPDAVIELAPLLLNRGDGVSISILTRSAPDLGAISLSGRVIGVKALKKTDRSGISAAVRVIPWTSVFGTLAAGAVGLLLIMTSSMFGAVYTQLTAKDVEVSLSGGRVICAVRTTDLADGRLVVLGKDGTRSTFPASEVRSARAKVC